MPTNNQVGLKPTVILRNTKLFKNIHMIGRHFNSLSSSNESIRQLVNTWTVRSDWSKTNASALIGQNHCSCPYTISIIYDSRNLSCMENMNFTGFSEATHSIYSLYLLRLCF